MPLDVDRIQKSVRPVRKFLAKAPKNPTPEKIHDLRTSARRLEATVEALGLDSKRREKRLLRDLAQVRKRAGKVRDMDVFTGHLLGLPQIENATECLIELAEHLGTKRAKAAKKLRRTVKQLESRLGAELKEVRRISKRVFREVQRAAAQETARDWICGSQ